MTFWLDSAWQRRTSEAIKEGLNGVHTTLYGKGLGAGAWTAETLRAIVRAARGACESGNLVCGLKFAPDEKCKGEWLYDFSCWLERPGGGGMLGMPIVVESEWGKWHDIWDDFDKLVQARAGLRVLVFEFHKRSTPDDWHLILSKRAKEFQPSSTDDAWLFACWNSEGFEFKYGLADL